MTTAAIASLLGGIGLFLLGMRMMTDGLRLAAGTSLQRILRDWTSTRWRGLLSGAGLTAMVQSSSAVTVATIGFVNAGLLTLPQAVAVTYGSNVGTTMTGWLVALVGFKIKIELFALPAIGAGMLLRLFGGERRAGFSGEALAGFGIFFVGIATLQGAFGDMAATLPLDRLGGGVIALLLFFGAGFVLSVLMQSSSAAIAITITAAIGGVIPLQGGAAMVIGANLGTTSTAALATIGATANARRVALAHVAFNSLTGVVALLLLPLLLLLLHWLQSNFDLAADPGTTLALFHTLFNLLGVFLMWPLTDRLVEFLGNRFRDREEDTAHPRFLDQTLIATPALAINALALELERVAQMVCTDAITVLRRRVAEYPAVVRDQRALTRLIPAIATFSGQLQRGKLLAETEPALPAALRATRCFREAADLAAARVGRESLQELPEYGVSILKKLETQYSAALSMPARHDKTAIASLKDARGEIRTELLNAMSAGRIDTQSGMHLLDDADSAYQMTRDILRGIQFLDDLRRVSGLWPTPGEALSDPYATDEPVVPSPSES